MSKGPYDCTWCREDHLHGCVNLACPVGYHNVLSTHPKEMEDETRDPIDRICDDSYSMGQIVAYESIAGRFRKQAGDLFANGQDTTARSMRALADELDQLAATARIEHKVKYGP